MSAITLKNRVTILLTIFTIINITVFTSVQLGYEAQRVNKFIQSKAVIVVSALEDTWNLVTAWENIVNLPFPVEKKLAFLEKKIKLLKEAQEISAATIFNKNAEIIFSTEGSLAEGKKDFYDIRVIDKMSKNEPIEKEIHMDKANRTFFTYIPLGAGQSIDYAVRLSFSLKDVWGIYQQVYQPVIIVGLLFIFINVFLGIFLSRLIVGPIKVFNEATKSIASGRLDLKVNMPTNDELEEMANTFNFMTQELIKMKERAENANPLTKLPGNIVIMEEVEKRIKENRKFMVIYCDLDNFKAFNDNYGIHNGDEAIKLAAEIFKEAIKNQSNNDDFLGHEGGDDFIILTTPPRADNIANYIIGEFDKRVRSFYNKEDLEKGYIVSIARDGSVKQFPIMTISLAGVTNAIRRIQNYAEVTNIAAEVKKKAKQECRSCFIVDKRRDITMDMQK